MDLALLVLVNAGYAATATAYLEARRRREAPPTWSRLVGPLCVAAHLLGLWLLGRALGQSPFHTQAQALSFLAFALAALYLVLEATSRVATHGGGFYLVVTILSALAVPGLLRGTATRAGAPDTARTLHVGLSLLGAAAVLASALLAIGYLGAYRRAKQARLAGGDHGPSLGGFERLARRASFLGMLLLLPAVVLGFQVDGLQHEGTPWLLITLTGVMLVALLASFLVWWRRPLRGPVAAWLTLGGTVLLVLALSIAHQIALGGVRA